MNWYDIKPAEQMEIDLSTEIKIGDTTTFRHGDEMIAVEVIGINHSDNTLKIMSCDLGRVWNRISRSQWLRQVEFMKQFNS